MHVAGHLQNLMYHLPIGIRLLKRMSLGSYYENMTSPRDHEILVLFSKYVVGTLGREDCIFRVYGQKGIDIHKGVSWHNSSDAVTGTSKTRKRFLT